MDSHLLSILTSNLIKADLFYSDGVMQMLPIVEVPS